MSSFVRRIQRSQKHIGLVEHKDPKTRSVSLRREEVPGRKTAFMGRGSKLGVTNPKAKDLLARKARDKKWGRK